MIKVQVHYGNNRTNASDDLLALFDIMGTILFSKSDKPTGTNRKIGLAEVVIAFPEVVETLNEMSSDGWKIVGLARNLKNDLLNALVAGTFGHFDEIIIGDESEILEVFQVDETSDASFYAVSDDPIIPGFLPDAQIYTGPEVFDDMWPKGQGPSIRNSGSDLIILVGTSGSGRDEASEFLTSSGYEEIRRGSNMKKIKTTIETKLRNGERLFFNATNPRVQDRREVTPLCRDARIWWFARPGRSFLKAKNGKTPPEHAFTRYSRLFEQPTPETDGVPVIRLT